MGTKRTAPAPEKTRVMVVDDHRAVAEALGTTIDVQDDLTCVGIASSIAEATDLLASAAPDVVLMDVELPDTDGIAGTARVKEMRPEIRVLVFTAHTDVDVMTRAAEAGACGFLPKESPITEILHAIRTAREGGMLIAGATLAGVLARVHRERLRPDPADRYSITKRELEVLGLMGEGLDPRTIAKRLQISLHTARGYVKNILSKLGAHSQLEAVVKATREGLIRSPA